MSPTTKPILCYVTDRRSLPVPPLGQPAQLLKAVSATITQTFAAGVDWVQIREKDLPGAALLTLAREAVAGAKGDSRVVINDRLDVAVAARAGGVHLGEASLPVAQVAQWVGKARAGGQAEKGFLVGASCHSLESARRAERAGADYVFFGPVFATPSKAAFGAPQGLHRLREVCASLPIPVLGIGGITLENARDCMGAGAAGIAAIRLFQQAPSIAEVVTALRKL